MIKLTDEGFFKLDKKYFKHFKDGVAMEWEGGSPNIDALYTKDWEDLFGRSRLKEKSLSNGILI